MYIKFKFTKKSHVCCKNNHTRGSCPLRTPRALANAPFTKYLDIHSFNSYTFDREQQKF